MNSASVLDMSVSVGYGRDSMLTLEVQVDVLQYTIGGLAVLLEREGILELSGPCGGDSLEFVVVGQLELDLEGKTPVLDEALLGAAAIVRIANTSVD